MSASSIYIVAGLGFGDEGKGTVTEFLARSANAEAVVRYNGGPQAAHHIVLPNGTWHCFSQFGSGSFVKTMRSHLAHSVLIKPSNLLLERDLLVKKGIDQINQRFSLDPSCFIVTPWHAMICRMEEAVRGDKRHGSVGMGVGKAAMDRRSHSPLALQILDLSNHPKLKQKLCALWERANTEAQALISTNNANSELRKILDEYKANTNPEIMFNHYCECSANLSEQFKTDQQFSKSLKSNSSIVLEGAQGALLDFEHGFFPHVTKTDTSFRSAQDFIDRATLSTAKITKVGILRAYATRHGAGPFVTQDSSLEKSYPETHNATHRWQGAFRVGNFDLVASRYAIHVSGAPDYLALTHLDTVGRQAKFSVCESYRYIGEAKQVELEEYFALDKEASQLIIKEIKWRPVSDQQHQKRLSELLFQCLPYKLTQFSGWPDSNKLKNVTEASSSLRHFLQYLESPLALGCPIKILSFGPTFEDKISI